MFGFSSAELSVLKKLRTASKIQDLLEAIPINFQSDGPTCLSPRRVLRENRAQCVEGALLAAAAFAVQGEEPLLLDLRTVPHDYDHVVALYKKYGCWGAVSKTNHAVLRYRDPVYKTLRELVLSYFHEYFTDDGKKTLREFSTRPFDLTKYNSRGWMTSEEDLWYIYEDLDGAPHSLILAPGQARSLRIADQIEIEAGKHTVWNEMERSAPQKKQADVRRTKARGV